MLFLNILYDLLSLLNLGLIFFRYHYFNFSNLLMFSYLFNNWLFVYLFFFLLFTAPALSLIFISLIFERIAPIYSGWLLPFNRFFLHFFNTSILIFLEILFSGLLHYLLVRLVHQIFSFLRTCNIYINITCFLLFRSHSFSLLNIIFHFLPLHFSFIQLLFFILFLIIFLLFFILLLFHHSLLFYFCFSIHLCQDLIPFIIQFFLSLFSCVRMHTL